jgi:hypothetical protein
VKPQRVYVSALKPPPYPCPFCPHITRTSAAEHRKHIEKHEQAERIGRVCDNQEARE